LAQVAKSRGIRVARCLFPTAQVAVDSMVAGSSPSKVVQVAGWQEQQGAGSSVEVVW